MPKTKNKKDKRKNQRRGPRNQWRGQMKPDEVGGEEFKLSVTRKRGKSKTETFSIDHMVTGFSWTDAEPVLTGSLSLVVPEGERVGFAHGDMVICTMRDNFGKGKWRELWRMRCESDTQTATSGAVELALASPLGFLQRSTDDWKFKKEKNGPHKDGWRAHEIARKVAKRYGFKLGNVGTPKHKVKSLVKQGTSPLDIIIAAYKEANQKEGRRYVIEWRDHKLHVRPLRYSRRAYVLGPYLIEAGLTRSLPEQFATAVTVRSTGDGGKKNKKKKVKELVEQKALSRRYGMVHRVIRDKEADSPAKARKRGKRWIDEHARLKRELNLTTPGLARLRRGDALRLQLPELNVTRVVFVKEVTHSVSAGGFESDVTVRYKDVVRELSKCEKRCKKARDRDRPLPKGCNCEKPAKKKKKNRKERNRR